MNKALHLFRTGVGKLNQGSYDSAIKDLEGAVALATIGSAVHQRAQTYLANAKIGRQRQLYVEAVGRGEITGGFRAREEQTNDCI